MALPKATSNEANRVLNIDGPIFSWNEIFPIFLALPLHRFFSVRLVTGGTFIVTGCNGFGQSGRPVECQKGKGYPLQCNWKLWKMARDFTKQMIYCSHVINHHSKRACGKRHISIVCFKHQVKNMWLNDVHTQLVQTRRSREGVGKRELQTVAER